MEVLQRAIDTTFISGTDDLSEYSATVEKRFVLWCRVMRDLLHRR